MCDVSSAPVAADDHAICIMAASLPLIPGCWCPSCRCQQTVSADRVRCCTPCWSSWSVVRGSTGSGGGAAAAGGRAGHRASVEAFASVLRGSVGGTSSSSSSKAGADSSGGAVVLEGDQLAAAAAGLLTGYVRSPEAGNSIIRAGLGWLM